jgi:hypothetical protein
MYNRLPIAGRLTGLLTTRQQSGRLSGLKMWLRKPDRLGRKTWQVEEMAVSRYADTIKIHPESVKKLLSCGYQS